MNILTCICFERKRNYQTHVTGLIFVKPVNMHSIML